jgi:ATP-binding cassette subfamily F protein 3
VTKTLEFRPGKPPKTYVGNITYYIEKAAEDKALELSAAKAGAAAAKANAAAPKTAPTVLPKVEAAPAASPAPQQQASQPGVNRKDQRRQEAEAREMRAKVLKPLEKEFEELEARIATQEADQAKWTEKLSDPAVSADPDQFRQASNEVAKVSTALETSYSRWGALSEEIDRIKARLGE